MCVVVYPLLSRLVMGGVRSSRLWSTCQPASPSIWSAVQSIRHGLSINSGVTTWCVCGRSWRDYVSCVVVCYKWGHSGDGCEFASTLCMYYLRKGDLIVLSWAMVRRVRRTSLSSGLLMCGGCVCSILVLPLVAKCLETIYVCIWCMFAFTAVVVTEWGSVGMFVV